MCQCIPLNNLRISEKDYIDKAIIESFKSDLCHKHGAVLVYRGKIISIGHNHMVYNKHCLYSIHAEVSVIKEFLRLGKRRGFTKNILKDCILYVVRSGKESLNYPLKMSKPCNNCYNFIKKHKIRKVYWTMNE